MPTNSARRLPRLVMLPKKRSKPECHCLCLLCLSMRCACCSSVHVAPNRQLPTLHTPKTFQPYYTPLPFKFLPRHFTQTLIQNYFENVPMHELESVQVARQITTTLINANVRVAHTKYKHAEQGINNVRVNNERTL